MRLFCVILRNSICLFFFFWFSPYFIWLTWFHIYTFYVQIGNKLLRTIRIEKNPSRAFCFCFFFFVCYCCRCCSNELTYCVDPCDKKEHNTPIGFIHISTLLGRNEYENSDQLCDAGIFPSWIHRLELWLLTSNVWLFFHCFSLSLCVLLSSWYLNVRVASNRTQLLWKRILCNANQLNNCFGHLVAVWIIGKYGKVFEMRFSGHFTHLCSLISFYVCFFLYFFRQPLNKTSIRTIWTPSWKRC